MANVPAFVRKALQWAGTRVHALRMVRPPRVFYVAHTGPDVVTVTFNRELRPHEFDAIAVRICRELEA